MTPACRRWLAERIEAALQQKPDADARWLLNVLLSESDLPMDRADSIAARLEPTRAKTRRRAA